MATKKTRKINKRRADRAAAKIMSPVLGRGAFAKISEVEGIRLTDDMKKIIAEFDRRKLSPEARRRAIINRFKRAGE